jgi:hypothetical protein
MIADETPDTQRDVAATLALYGGQPVVAIEGLTFTEDQILGAWFPDEPAWGDAPELPLYRAM